jgi:hypothetical protein
LRGWWRGGEKPLGVRRMRLTAPEQHRGPPEPPRGPARTDAMHAVALAHASQHAERAPSGSRDARPFPASDAATPLLSTAPSVRQGLPPSPHFHSRHSPVAHGQPRLAQRLCRGRGGACAGAAGAAPPAARLHGATAAAAGGRAGPAGQWCVRLLRSCCVLC